MAKAIYKPLSPVRGRRMTERLTGIAERALKGLLEQGEGDLAADYAHAIALGFWTELLGLPEADAPLLSQWSAAIRPMLQFEHTEAEREAANQAAAELRAFMHRHYGRIKDAPGNALLHLLAPDIAACGLPDAPPDPATMAAAVTFDGIDSAAGGVANALYACLRFPDQYAKLAANPRLAPAACAEAMRYAPSFIGLHRSALEDLAYADVRIPAGVNVFMCWGAANRDPRIFPAPDRFDIERQGKRHLSFGGGVRICKGRYLAKLEAELALKVLLEKNPVRGIAAGQAGLEQARRRQSHSIPAGENCRKAVTGNAGNSIDCASLFGFADGSRTFDSLRGHGQSGSSQAVESARPCRA